MKGEISMFGRRGCGCGVSAPKVMQVPGCNKVNMHSPVYHQPIQFVKQNTFTHIVPHVHPVHTTEVNNHLFKHAHHYPHTYQSVSPVANQQCHYGSPMPPKPGCC